MKDPWCRYLRNDYFIQNLTQFVNRYLTILENTKFWISKSLVSGLLVLNIVTILVISSLNFSKPAFFMNSF